ncbi:MAG TPA: glycosyltransferase [Pyrinomonadaceae bacterium]|jgi:glycosyltransferase involved in cell wall biosynthesis|nr:glycosyltransferase [Pyrinomonadaceae bacterium]
MRICYLANGRYIHTLRWLRFFKEKGYEQHVISFVPMEPQHVNTLEEAGGIYQGSIDGFHLKRFWLTARGMRQLARVLRRERIDALHCHFLGANAWYAALSGFRPLVITVMGGGDICGPDWRPRGLRERLLTPLALRRAALVTSWSHVMAGVVRRYCRERTPVEVIHGGVDLRRFGPGPKPARLRERWELPPDARVVFSPRLMRPLSNLHVVAEAAGRVVAAEPRAYFLFAAPGEQWEDDYEERVRSAARDSGAGDHVRFIKAIPHQEMADYHRLADVTVSVPATDGTPMTVLESMACGTPVIVGDIPDYDPYYFEQGKTVLAADVNDPLALADALLRLLREPRLAESLSAEARRRVETKGSYEAQMSRMDELYRGLVR